MAVRVVPVRPPGRPKNATTALVPAAARAPEVLSAPEEALNVEAVEAFTQVIGGKDALTAVLSVAEGDPAVEKVVGYLLDPRYDRWTLRRLCRLAGLTVVDLFTAYKAAVLTRAHIEATHIIARQLPPIVEDVMSRATPQPQVCPLCGGDDIKRASCQRCGGSGVVRSEPDLDRQKLALDLGQLTEKKGGIVMQQNTIAAGALTATAPGALEQLQQAVGDLLFSPGPRGRRVGAGEAAPVEVPAPEIEPLDEEEPFLPFDPRELPRPEPRHPHDAGEPEE
jgi:hypothetical protein